MLNNPFSAVNKQYAQARRNARTYIMENCYWSLRTYYRKMEGKDALTDYENEIIATAYKNYIHQPMMLLLSTNQQAN